MSTASPPDETASRQSESADPTPRGRERAIDGLLRAAANTAPKVLGGALGVELRQLLWIYYNTDGAYGFGDLARAILAYERGGSR